LKLSTRDFGGSVADKTAVATNWRLLLWIQDI